MIKEIIEKILTEQNDHHTVLIGAVVIPIDIQLVNGNITLKSFRIIELNGNVIKGVTRLEEYSAPRENRKVKYSYFELKEIKNLVCFELDLEYNKNEFVSKQ